MLILSSDAVVRTLVFEAAAGSGPLIDEDGENGLDFVDDVGELDDASIVGVVAVEERILEAHEIFEQDSTGVSGEMNDGFSELVELGEGLVGDVLAAVVGAVAAGVFAEVVVFEQGADAGVVGSSEELGVEELKVVDKFDATTGVLAVGFLAVRIWRGVGIVSVVATAKSHAATDDKVAAMGGFILLPDLDGLRANTGVERYGEVFADPIMVADGGGEIVLDAMIVELLTLNVNGDDAGAGSNTNKARHKNLLCRKVLDWAKIVLTSY